jgi:S-DNA-T family DNA segregation ATPase FtsK/SpoIIIE
MVGLAGSRRRARIREALDALQAAVAAALGAAGRVQEAAAAAHAQARLEMVLRTEGLDAARADPSLAKELADSHMAAVVAVVEADRAALFGDWLATAPERLDAILAEAAPGSAGAEPSEWLGQVGKADGSGRVPGLWRIGSAQVGADERHRFGVGVPLLDAAHLQIGSTHETRAAAEALVESLLMRVLSHFRPGMVQLHVWDVGQFTGALPGLYPLTRTGLLTVHDPGRLPQLLEELSDRIRRVHTRVLVDGHPSLTSLWEATGSRTEPWVVAVLVGNRAALREEDYRQLQRVARGGPACGVHLVLLDVPMTVNAPVETVQLRADADVQCSMTGPYAPVTLDRPLPREEVTAACHALSDDHERWRTRVGSFRDLLPEASRWCTTSSAAGLRAPIGFADGVEVDLVLADSSPHALVGGPSGSGKTNLLLAMIGSLAARYGPDELELHLLDFKEGVSFAQFAPGRRDPTWLPQARLIGVNINTDREFGLALLKYLADEMRRRAEAAKAVEVTKLEELRREDPNGRWPRIVAVIDEFQILFAERDAVTRTATALLEDVARRGRSQGIHLVLASQDVSGIEAFWGRPAIFEQFVLRIALPRARRVLADLNDAALGLPRWHAVVNHESGIRHGNEVVRIPDATGRGSVDEVQHLLHDAYNRADNGATRDPDRSRPRLFDGSRAPRVADLLAAWPPRTGAPKALVGQCIDVAGSAATVELPDVPGRNLAVLGSTGRDAVRVLGAAAVSLAGQFDAGGLDVLLAPLVPDGEQAAAELAAVFAGAGHESRTVFLDGFREQVDALAAEIVARQSGGPRRTTLLVVHGADAADPVLGRPGTEALRQVLRFGPEVGVHVLGWWRSVARLKALLSIGAAPDDVGVFVGLDVQGAELTALAPGLMLSWAPRPGRGLLFDRAQHAQPEVVIVPSRDVAP